jgi:hypothetical protein
MSAEYESSALSLEKAYITASSSGYLNLSGTFREGDTELPPFPESVTSLSLRDFPHLRKLPPLPPGLRSLGLYNCPELGFDLEEGAVLPATLQTLILWSMPKVQTLPPLPNSLCAFACNNTGLETLPSVLPSNLRQLSITASALRTVPALPATVRHLGIWDCPLLTTVEGFSAELCNVEILRNPLLTSLPQLPHQCSCSHIDVAGHST